MSTAGDKLRRIQQGLVNDQAKEPVLETLSYVLGRTYDNFYDGLKTLPSDTKRSGFDAKNVA